MEPSPLTQQARPETFQPKIVKLYERLLKEEEDTERNEGFWKEFFLLRPEKRQLQKMIADFSPNEILDIQYQTRQLFSRAVGCVRARQEPSDEIALDTLTAFLGALLSKRFTNMSSDVISVLSGMDSVDAIFSDLVDALDTTIKSGRSLQVRQKAVEVSLSITSGAYQTGLLSYFTYRDLFPALVKVSLIAESTDDEYIQESPSPGQAFQPFVLLGLLVNYNKFEFQNPYRMRLEDFVNEATIQKIVRAVGDACSGTRDRYIAVMDDSPTSWSLTSTVAYMGSFLSSKPVQQTPHTDATKKSFAGLPGPEAAILLATYDFVHANKLFCFNLLALGAEKTEESPIASFLSSTSYILHHAHRSSRSGVYAYLNLLIIRILAEDPALSKRICDDSSSCYVRLCRQRQPYLPVITTPRVLAASIFDIVIDGLNHNLKRRLDVDLYILLTAILTRLISQLSRTKVRISYHWSELWRSILSLIRFLSSYSNDLANLPRIQTLNDNVANLIALSLSSGDAFLPGPQDYDDLFYKLVETGAVLVKFRDLYGLASRPTNSIGTLISVSEHYYQLIEDSRMKMGSKNLSPAQVAQVIKQGYETLSIDAKEGLDAWERYREVDERTILKRAAKIVVADCRTLLGLEDT